MQVEPDLLGGVSDTCRWSQSGWEGYETYVVGAKVVGMVRGQSRWSQSGGEVYGKHEGGDRVVGMVRGTRPAPYRCRESTWLIPGEVVGQLVMVIEVNSCSLRYLAQ